MKNRNVIEDYEAGKSYHCDYWNYNFKVLAVNVNSIYGSDYVCEMLQDWNEKKKGHVWSHSTRRDKRDYELTEATI